MRKKSRRSQHWSGRLPVAGDAHTRSMAASAIVLVDDLRSFRDGRPCLVARTSVDGVELLRSFRGRLLDELWLDQDLGGDDTIRPVVAELEEGAFNGEPYDVELVIVHTSNPAGGDMVVRALRRWGYRVVVRDPAAYFTTEGG